MKIKINKKLKLILTGTFLILLFWFIFEKLKTNYEQISLQLRLGVAGNITSEIFRN